LLVYLQISFFLMTSKYKMLFFNIMLAFLLVIAVCQTISGQPTAQLKKQYLQALKAQNKQLAAQLAEQIAEKARATNYLDEAIEYYHEYQKLISSRGNERRLAEVYNILGDIFLEDDDHLGALKEYTTGLQMFRFLRDSKNVARCQIRIGWIYLELGDSEKALEALREAYNISLKQDLGLALLSECHRNLYLTYETINDKEKALDFYKSHITLQEKLQQEELAQISSQIEKELEEREQLITAKEQDLQAKLDAGRKELSQKEQTIRQIQEEKAKMEELNILRAREIEYLKKQDETDRQLLHVKEKQLYYSIGLLILSFFFGLVVLWAFRQTKLKNQLISKQKIELEQANELIRTNNKNMLDSIRYAQKIQSAILSVEHKLSHAFPEHFILYRPKDIVSGDFYWFDQLPDGSVISVVADCTGHGVPGAFMSLIGTVLLHEIIDVEQIYEPSYILEHLHKRVRVALKQENNVNDDGMDVCLCRIGTLNENGEHILTFAGAKRPLYICHQGQLTELTPTRKTIGGRQKPNEVRKFEQVSVTVNPDTMIYLSTDGYHDQHNPQEQKIGSTRLKEWLTQISHLSVGEQKTILEQYFSNHIQNQIQRDDVTLVGIRIK